MRKKKRRGRRRRRKPNAKKSPKPSFLNFVKYSRNNKRRRWWNGGEGGLVEGGRPRKNDLTRPPFPFSFLLLF